MATDYKEEFEMRKELIELETKLQKLKHKLKLEALAYIRTNQEISHQKELERVRIKFAEQRKADERRYFGGYKR